MSYIIKKFKGNSNFETSKYWDMLGENKKNHKRNFPNVDRCCHIWCAIRAYIDDPGKNIPKLIEYAGPLRVKKAVKDLIGVWL